LNDFIAYRNNKFKPTLPDEEIDAMVRRPTDILSKCKNSIYQIGSIGIDNKSTSADLRKAVESNLRLANEQTSFVKNYLSKSKLARKTMFSKISWYGIPLN
jgi:hypothetical protein